jgi:hypothetical protein
VEQKVLRLKRVWEQEVAFRGRREELWARSGNRLLILKDERSVDCRVNRGPVCHVDRLCHVLDVRICPHLVERKDELRSESEEY